jgi:hypothetical protein
LGGSFANLTWNALKDATASDEVGLYDERGIRVPDMLEKVLAGCEKNGTDPDFKDVTRQLPRRDRPLWFEGEEGNADASRARCRLRV